MVEGQLGHVLNVERRDTGQRTAEDEKNRPPVWTIGKLAVNRILSIN